MKLREKDPWVFCLAGELERGVRVCYKARKENPGCKLKRCILRISLSQNYKQNTSF